jgi:hypothetical protein
MSGYATPLITAIPQAPLSPGGFWRSGPPQRSAQLLKNDRRPALKILLEQRHPSPLLSFRPINRVAERNRVHGFADQILRFAVFGHESDNADLP